MVAVLLVVSVREPGTMLRVSITTESMGGTIAIERRYGFTCPTAVAMQKKHRSAIASLVLPNSVDVLRWFVKVLFLWFVTGSKLKKKIVNKIILLRKALFYSAYRVVYLIKFDK